MNIDEFYRSTMLYHAAYANILSTARFKRNLADEQQNISFVFANNKHAQEVSDNYNFIWQYNDSLPGFLKSVFKEKTSGKYIGVFKGPDFRGAPAGGADVLVAYTRLNSSISGGQSVKTI